MPAAYSNDLRKRIINAIERGEKVSKIVKIFEVKKTAVYDLKKKYNETGDYRAKPNNGGRPPKLSDGEIKDIKELIQNQPDIGLQEIIDTLNLPVCISALCRTINNKLNLRFKKNAPRIRAK